MKYVCLRGWNGPRHARAVNLIELIGAVIVAMILMHIAPPAYKKFIAQAHANNALQSARSLMPYLVELHGQHGTFEIIDISSVTSEGGVITADGQQTGMLLPNYGQVIWLPLVVDRDRIIISWHIKDNPACTGGFKLTIDRDVKDISISARSEVLSF